MSWARRGLLAVPFAVAGLLNVLGLISRPLHLRTQHIAAYGFLFGAPWAWLLDRRWSDTFTADGRRQWSPTQSYCGFPRSCIPVVCGS
jgi:hypothetical protein